MIGLRSYFRQESFVQGIRLSRDKRDAFYFSYFLEFEASMSPCIISYSPMILKKFRVVVYRIPQTVFTIYKA